MGAQLNRVDAKGVVQTEIGDLYRLLVDRVLDYAIFALDPNGIILSWNAGAERLKGYTADEVIGKHFSIFYPPEALAVNRPAEELQIARKAGRVEEEGWRLRKDGTRFWANVLITALRDDNGNLVGYAKLTRDLTARRAAEEELRMSEQRFRLLVQSVQDYAIFMLDPNGYVATWNEGAERIKGYSASEIIGQHFSVFLPPEEIGKAERELEIATREGSYQEEGLRVRKDGSRFWASVVITAIHDSTGKLAGFAKITRDLTERRAADERAIENARKLASEETARVAAEQRAQDLRELSEQLRVQAAELERQREEAEVANRVKSEFLAAMSHELRTPLNAIGGYAQLMQLGLSGPVTEEQMKQLDRVQRSQQHLLSVINDILNFSRLEAGRITYDIHPMPVRDALASVSPIIEPMAESLGISLHVGECGPDVVALADRLKVEQILINLLSNAAKFTESGGTIDLTCDADESRVWLKVRDTGVGIPDEYMETIFSPFEQVNRSLASPKEGTGLGLTISRDLAHGMGGDLTAESKIGEGSTFTLILPRAPVSSTG
jgi:PAS domain S-box-containing protein